MASTATTSARMNVRFTDSEKRLLEYWASKNSMSASDYVREAVSEKIGRENGDYSLPTLEIARLAQLVDATASLADRVRSLEAVTVEGFSSLLSLTRGDSYLYEDVAGEGVVA